MDVEQSDTRYTAINRDEIKQNKGNRNDSNV